MLMRNYAVDLEARLETLSRARRERLHRRPRDRDAVFAMDLVPRAA